MGNPRLHHDFMQSARFQVPHKTLYVLAAARAKALREMVEIREKRILATRETNNITDTVMIRLLEQAQKGVVGQGGFYSTTVTVKDTNGTSTEETISVPVGVVGALQAERAAIDTEQSIIDTMDMILAAVGISASVNYELTLDDIRDLGAVPLRA